MGSPDFPSLHAQATVPNSHYFDMEFVSAASYTPPAVPTVALLSATDRFRPSDRTSSQWCGTRPKYHIMLWLMYYLCHVADQASGLRADFSFGPIATQMPCPCVFLAKSTFTDTSPIPGTCGVHADPSGQPADPDVASCSLVSDWPHPVRWIPLVA